MSVAVLLPGPAAPPGRDQGHRAAPGRGRATGQGQVGRLAHPARALLRLRAGSATGASLARFLAAGGSANLLYLLTFWLLADTGAQTANAVGSILSTVVANELHRRLTFHARTTVSWQTAQLQGGGLALAGLAVTSVALAGADLLLTAPSTGAHTLIISTVTGLVGLARFVLLRSWFTDRTPRTR